MTESAQLMEALDARVRRREERRDFFRAMAGGAAVAAGAALMMPTGAAAQAVSDADILNFALNLEYLEAQFYNWAAFGAGLPAAATTGVGTPGAVTGGALVPFSDPLVAQYAREIALDERAHVLFLRTVLGGAAVAMPALNIAGDSTGAFTAAARAAGVVGAGATFNPYADDISFLLGAFIFEDVGVTAYKGAAPLLANKTYLEAAAGIHAAEAYHAGLIRSVLYRKGVATPTIITNAGLISDARDSLDGTADLDQGIGSATVANIVPADADGITYTRTTGQVLNIAYLNKAMVNSGGFFPAGINGNIRASAAN